MTAVRIISDTLALELPIGEVGYILRTDRHIDEALTYLVRAPSKKENWWVPECDLETNETYISQEVDNIIHTHLVDVSLATRNEEMFQTLTKKETCE